MIVLESLRDFFVDWLVRDAYPLWSRNGVDQATGGFIEALGQDGIARAYPLRARVSPRQIYAFAQAPEFGWQGDAAGIVDNGLSYFMRHYRRADGLFLTLAAADGSARDERALLYDQAFVLLGYAAAALQLDAVREWESRALELRDLIGVFFDRHAGAYRAEEGAVGYESNPHMHLLEAYVAWAEIGNDPGWITGIQSLVELAVTRFIRKDSGALGEFYTPMMRPTSGASGKSIEPGHQFEWAWLLLRCERWLGPAVRECALRLISIGERYGVHQGFAVNALRDDFTTQDANSRLWPQCERLKAALLAAALTDRSQYRSMAHAAADSLRPYLGTRIPGLWFDARMRNGELQGHTVPASTFYHLVSAIATLRAAANTRS